jgi:FAD dependent oxidoreductase
MLAGRAPVAQQEPTGIVIRRTRAIRHTICRFRQVRSVLRRGDCLLMRVSGDDAPPLLEAISRDFAPAMADRRSINRTNRTVPRVCVLGAGVAGLSTAAALLDVLPGCDITLLAEQWGSDLTSAGAAGIWMPYKLSETPEDLSLRWSGATLDHLMDLVHSRSAAAAGVQPVRASCLFLAPEPDPYWSGLVTGFRRMKSRELERFSSSVDWDGVRAAATEAEASAAATAEGWTDGYAFDTVQCCAACHTEPPAKHSVLAYHHAPMHVTHHCAPMCLAYHHARFQRDTSQSSTIDHISACRHPQPCASRRCVALVPLHRGVLYCCVYHRWCARAGCTCDGSCGALRLQVQRMCTRALFFSGLHKLCVVLQLVCY